jgi:hypothetical protein
VVDAISVATPPPGNAVDLAGPVRLIGKEANNIDEVQAGRYAQLDEIITEYGNPTDDPVQHQVMPALDHLSGRDLASSRRC